MSLLDRILSDHERAVQNRKIRNLLDALATDSGGLMRLAEDAEKLPKAYFDAFEQRYDDFECLNLAIADHFDRYPEERKRYQLADKAQSMAYLVLRRFVRTCQRYLDTMAAQEDLPLGIRCRFDGLRHKMEQLRSRLALLTPDDSARETAEAEIDQAARLIEVLMARSTDLPDFTNLPAVGLDKADPFGS